MSTSFEAQIEALWDRRAELTSSSHSERDLVGAVLDQLDDGKVRVAEKIDGEWVTHQWLKKAVLLSFRLWDNTLMGAPFGMNLQAPTTPGPWWDKVPNKFSSWDSDRFAQSGIRAVPGSIVRRGAYIARGAVLMPSFVNIGGYVGENSMVDGWSTVGSCAQIGANVHLSGGVGIGGVLEPLQANPTIIEDDCFIGARSEVAEGVIVEQGSVLSMGVFLSASTKIVDRATGEIFRGRVPAYSVVVPGTLPDPKGGPGLYCAVIVKRVDAQTRSKTSINDLLRD
jgi:2,3,4,5-tetrahydropyridine-2-carboxylate N-succinyltransferase